MIDRSGALETKARAPEEPDLRLQFDTALGPLAYFTIQSVFALPQDVTAASLRIELWFPVDAAARAVTTENRQFPTT